jgi:predicted Na+-dependent transporter
MSLATIQTILLIIYIASTMLLMGIRLTWSKVKTLADHGRLITRAIVVNILIIPAVAIILVRVIDMEEALAVETRTKWGQTCSYRVECSLPRPRM